MFGKWKEINEHSSEHEIQSFIDELMPYVDLYITSIREVLSFFS